MSKWYVAKTERKNRTSIYLTGNPNGVRSSRTEGELVDKLNEQTDEIERMKRKLDHARNISTTLTTENEQLQREKDVRVMCDHNGMALTLGDVQKRLERLEAERNLYCRALEGLRAKGPSHHLSTYVDRLVGDALRSACKMLRDDLARKGSES